MTAATLSASDAEVLDALAAEIDSITEVTGSEGKVTYKPQAWTREGRVD